MSKTLATKLHDALCPKCNGHCHCNSLCVFDHQPADDSIWETNAANSYFLALSEKATQIISETSLSEDELIAYAKKLPCDIDQIPDNVLALMEANDLW